MQSEQLTTADIANTATGHDRPETDKPVNPPSDAADQYSGPLLSRDFSEDMRTRWETIQTGFVDDPRTSVQEADELVAAAIKKLAESFADERSKLEQEWSKGNDVSTENLRQALRRYRAFFHRLLAI
jgi:sugar phosphate isomerase/epimerase